MNDVGCEVEFALGRTELCVSVGDLAAKAGDIGSDAGVDPAGTTGGAWRV
jgi:hypothetical protein